MLGKTTKVFVFFLVELNLTFSGSSHVSHRGTREASASWPSLQRGWLDVLKLLAPRGSPLLGLLPISWLVTMCHHWAASSPEACKRL